MASQVATVGVIPIKKRCWRTPPDSCTCIVFTILDGWESNATLLQLALLRVLPAAGVTEQTRRQIAT